MRAKKSYKHRFLDFLILNETRLWRGNKLNLLGGFNLYLTNSYISFQFFLNFLNELAVLSKIHMSQTFTPSLHNIISIRNLLLEEQTAVQKKFGPRYIQSTALPIKTRRKTLNKLTTREYYFTQTRPNFNDLQVKYIIWNFNLIEADFFFHLFWRSEKGCLSLLQQNLWTASTLSLYNIILVMTFLRASILNFYLISKTTF